MIKRIRNDTSENMVSTALCGLTLFRRILPAMAAIAIMTGCTSTQRMQLPPVTSMPTGEVHVGKFVWVDLLTEDVQSASAFYGGLFGWRARTSLENDEYYVFFKGGEPIGGMVATENQKKQAPESLWLLSLSVDDVDRAVARHAVA